MSIFGKTSSCDSIKMNEIEQMITTKLKHPAGAAGVTFCRRGAISVACFIFFVLKDVFIKEISILYT